MNLFIRRVTPVLALCLAPVTSAFAGAADPTQPVPGTSLPPYRSAFSDYKPLKEDKPGDWRALNDAVKDEGMGDMPGMGVGKGTEGGMPGMGKAPGQAMPKEGAAAASAKSRAPAAAPSMPAMKGMSDNSMHGMPGGKP